MSKKLKKLIKNKTLVIGIVIGLTLGISGVALASTLLYSSDVTYDNTSSGLSSTNLQDALDELYEQAKNAPECDSNGVCTVTCSNGFYSTSTGYWCVPASTSIGGKSVGVVTSGDGLYADSATSGRYIYRGKSPSNYITVNGETWRIISIESDGTLKIIRNQQLSSKYAWDTAGTRSSSTSTYCANAENYGCNAWAATSSLIGASSNFIQYYPYGNSSNATSTYSGTVTKDSSLNTYLNGTYYSGLSSTTKAKVVKGTFNVSTPGNTSDTETLEVDAQQEKQYQWKGYVALMNVTELLRASTSTGCTSLSAGSSSITTCNSNNWLWPTFNTYEYEWTLSPAVDSDRYSVWRVNSDGRIGVGGWGLYTANSLGVRPVLHLSSNIILVGSGTSSDPYTIN